MLKHLSEINEPISWFTANGHLTNMLWLHKHQVSLKLENIES